MQKIGFLDQVEQSATRFERAVSRRAEKKAESTDQDWELADSVERFVRRLESKGMTSEARAMASWKPGDPLAFDPRERILADNELTSSTVLYQGAAQTHSTGRVVVRNRRGRAVGYGTGFLVSPSLLMTNNHVLEDRDEAATSAVEFFFWEDLSGRTGDKVTYDLDPDRFFETDEDLDFTLVAVRERTGVPSLASLGWAPLIRESGKATVDEAVNIIQHPKGGDQKVVLRQNKILHVEGDFLHYEADTQPGSSGSPVYNVDWELAALHHSSVPDRDGNGVILLRDGTPWNGDPARADEIHWIANEGVRISRIVAELDRRAEERGAAWHATYGGCFQPAPPFDAILPGVGSSTPPGAGPVTSPTDDPESILQALRRLFALDRDDDEAPGSPTIDEIDRDYSTREGYDSGFLGSGRFRVRLPELRAGSSEADGVTLDYHTFSVRMNPARRLARYTASNIHGRKLHGIRRADGRTRWIFDRRIPTDHQYGDDLYALTRVDKGHLVRRLDAAWGDDRDTALAGNDDTFHYTNAIPQHEFLNEDDESWAGLEDHYLDHADARDRKITVFTGAVYRDDDPEFTSPRGETALLPRRLWKVIVYRSGGRLAADAYLLSQEAFLRDDLGLEEEAFGGDDFHTFQVPLARIEELTDLDFGGLAEGDTFEEMFGEEELTPARSGGGVRPIRSLDDITF